MRDRPTFREVLTERVVVADGAMGTMLQAHDLPLDEFEGHEGCNDILNITRPDIVRDTHAAFLAVGTDCIGTNTFSANYGGLVEYGIEDRSHEIAEAGARIAREAADAHATPEQIADRITEWHEQGGADGFNLMPPSLPGGVEDFVDHVVPVLQKRGLFRSEYEARTLRGHLGLPRPPSAH